MRLEVKRRRRGWRKGARGYEAEEEHLRLIIDHLSNRASSPVVATLGTAVLPLRVRPLRIHPASPDTVRCFFLDGKCRRLRVLSRFNDTFVPHESVATHTRLTPPPRRRYSRTFSSSRGPRSRISVRRCQPTNHRHTYRPARPNAWNASPFADRHSSETSFVES